MQKTKTKQEVIVFSSGQKYQIQSLAQMLRSFSVIASIGIVYPVYPLIVVICVVQYKVIDTA